MAGLVNESGNPVGHKFSTNEKGSVVIAGDSDAALNWLQIARGMLARKTTQHQMQVALGAAPEQVPSSAPGPAAGDPRIVFVEALKLLSDFWLIEKHPPKRIAGRWLIQVQGPGPARWAAGWRRRGKKAQSGTRSAETSRSGCGSLEKWWRWVPDAGELDPFLREQGSWFFFGLLPNFSGGLWSFASGSPELGFYFKGRSYGAKFKLTEANDARGRPRSGRGARRGAASSNPRLSGRSRLARKGDRSSAGGPAHEPGRQTWRSAG